MKEKDINKISLEELKNNSKRYAQESTTDELLDALNSCREDPKRKEVIIDILKIQQNFEYKEDHGLIGELNLSTLLDKFHTDTDAYSLKHILIENGAEDPEQSFKFGLLRIITSLLEGKSLSEEEYYFLEKFNIDASDSVLLNRLQKELELDLKSIYSIKNDNFVDVSSYQLIQDLLHGYHLSVTKNNSVMRHSNDRLDGKKFIPGHCAFDDSPSHLKHHDEDVVEYNLGDEFIPRQNHADDLELLNKINKASVEELEKMYLEKKSKDDLEFWKIFYEDDNNGYILHLKDFLLKNYIDILDMYKKGDRFMVVKATYKDKEIFLGEYINCWYVDVYSEKTKKIYRVLSN